MSLDSDPAKVSVWRERFARRETSELTTSQFCTSEGISKPSFYAWRQKQGSTVFNVPANIAIYLHTAPTDMRKGIDGLSGMVRSEFSGDPLDGSLYLFVNRRGDRLKILHWDGSGFWIYYRVLEQGTFEVPRSEKLPEHLPRYEVEAEVAEELKNCPAHGQRKVIGYDTVETLEFERPKLKVRVTK